MVPPRSLLRCVLVGAVLAGACTTTGAEVAGRSPAPGASPAPSPPGAAAPPSAHVVEPTPDGSGPVSPSEPSASATAAPAWLGTRELPRRPDGYGEVRPTPADLDPRHIVTRDLLPPPDGPGFRSSIEPVPDEVLARSTWHEDCPVAADDLRYVLVPFWGFDGRPHTGELLVAAEVAEDLVQVFAALHAARFPLEEMRIVSPVDMELPPTGDGNNTTAFVCRPTRGRTSWSQHALGLAVDVNPFHNPYVRGDVVLPELASTYTDRDDVRRGMVVPGDAVTSAFAAIGWGWGGDWTRPYDPMHFSADGT